MEEQEIIKALDLYFNRENPPKFLNTSRIPLICQDINGIRKTLEEIKKSEEKREDDYELRLRNLEKNLWKFTGAASVIGAVGMWALEHFIK